MNWNSCGARKIDDLQNKLLEYKSIIEDLEDAEALETIRSDLMTYLQQANSEMTSLLEEKVNSENGTFLPECSMEELDVINKIKQVPFFNNSINWSLYIIPFACIIAEDPCGWW